jgi:predicted enzyme related to lactoylglutathione lyase
MTHAVVHFEIGGPDNRQLADFYSGLLGWRMQPVPGVGYTLVDTCGGSGINGGISTGPDEEPSATFYIETDDLQAVLDKVNLLGGKTVTAITELPGMVTYAKFEDLDGLTIGLVLEPTDPVLAGGGMAGTGQAEAVAQGSGQAMALGPSAGAGAPVDWFEILGADPERSQRFYAEIFGWQIDGGQGYRMVDTGTTRGIRGGIGAGQQSSWATVYASVAAVEAVLARAVELGGSREYGPLAVDDHMQTGALRDPAGNVFGVYQHRPHE